jgi:gliding motility-associated-like protein
VYFTTTSDFNPGNIVTVQLSDINGSFSNLQNIGSKTTVHSDSILITLPANISTSPNYKIRLVASSPLDTTASYPIWIHSLPIFNLGNDTVLCTGSTINLNTGQQPADSKYLWQNNSNNNFFTLNSAGLYWCEIQNSCGTVRDSILISPKQKPVFNIGNDSSFCSGASIIVQSSVQSPDYSYLWNTGSTDPSISIKNSGLYWLKVSNVCGNNIDTINTKLYSLPSLTLSKDSIICRGTPRVLEAGKGFANYLWSTGESTPSIAVNNTGLYWVKITDNHSCSNSDSLLVTQIVDPAKNFIPKSDSICATYGNLTISSPNIFADYLWNNGMGTNSIVINKPGAYWLTVTDKYLCKSTDTIIVYAKKCLEGFYIPTAFTPNGDGLNDAFKPIIGGNPRSYHFNIYDRWGKLVFTTTNFKTGWDGRFKNLLYDSGIFIWTCTFELDGYQNNFKKGTVILIR